jgi:hypothetical protein
MEHLTIIEQALNVATQKGAFNLADTAAILNALNGLKQQLEGKEASIKKAL